MFLSAIAMISSGLPKTKKKTLGLQLTEAILSAIGLSFLGSYPGAIVCLFSIATEYLCYKEKLTRVVKTLLILSSVIFSLIFNNIAWIGLLPIASFVIFTIFMNTNNMMTYKFLFLISILFWLIHDIYIQSYTDIVFDIIFVFTTIYGMIILKKDKKKKEMPPS